MWHPFALFAPELVASPAWRDARPPGRRRAAYGERVARWFKEAPGETYKQPILDHGPGIVLEVGPARGNERTSTFRMEWIHASPRRVEGELTCESFGWRSPTRWSWRQSFTGPAESPLLPPLEEKGTWDGRQVRCEASAGEGRMGRAFDSIRLLSPLAWLADFPAGVEPLAWSRRIVVMDEGTRFSGGGAIEPVAGPLSDHPLAAGLRGIRLRHGGGMPFEFWVNAHGLVVLMVVGPTRAFVLDSLEELA